MANLTQAMTPDVQRDLNAEADARFQAQTGVIRKLDPKNPLDQKLMPMWIQIYGRVKKAWQDGTLSLTHAHPAVVEALGKASIATGAAAQSMDNAARAITQGGPDAREIAEKHIAEAHAQHEQAQRAAALASQYQPPTISPAYAHHAAHEVLSFVMNAGGVGVPVITNGADAVTAMQATAAPIAATAVATATLPSVPSVDPAAIAISAPALIDQVHEHPHAGKVAAIGMAIVAALGLGAFAVSQSRGRGRRKAA